MTEEELAKVEDDIRKVQSVLPNEYMSNVTLKLIDEIRTLRARINELEPEGVAPTPHFEPVH